MRINSKVTMHNSRLTIILLLAIAASNLILISPVDCMAPPAPPDFSIQIVSIAYNVTSLNSTAFNGTAIVTSYNKADLQISFSTSDAVEYINDGYYLFYDIRYKNHFEPEWLAEWHTIYDDDYPRQVGSVRATTANCSVTYPSNVPNLSFQARILMTQPSVHWHYERIDNKWVRVNQTVLISVGSSDWSSSQTLTGLNGYLPVTPKPSNPTSQSTTPTSTPLPTSSAAPNLGNGNLLEWLQIAIPTVVGIVGGVILLRAIYVLRSRSKTSDSNLKAGFLAVGI